ncbi:MAG: hypothetical protein WCC73_02820, partial [Terracidiphilus sp.]
LDLPDDRPGRKNPGTKGHRMNFRIGDRGGGHQIADSSGKLNFVVGFADFGVHLGVHVVSTKAQK